MVKLGLTLSALLLLGCDSAPLTPLLAGGTKDVTCTPLRVSPSHLSKLAEPGVAPGWPQNAPPKPLSVKPTAWP